MSDPRVWKVAVERRARFLWRWTVSAPVRPPSGGVSAVPIPQYGVPRAVACGNTFTRRGAEREARWWIQEHVRNRDSLRTFEVET